MKALERDPDEALRDTRPISATRSRRSRATRHPRQPQGRRRAPRGGARDGHLRAARRRALVARAQRAEPALPSRATAAATGSPVDADQVEGARRRRVERLVGGHPGAGSSPSQTPAAAAPSWRFPHAVARACGLAEPPRAFSSSWAPSPSSRPGNTKTDAPTARDAARLRPRRLHAVERRPSTTSPRRPPRRTRRSRIERRPPRRPRRTARSDSHQRPPSRHGPRDGQTATATATAHGDRDAPPPTARPRQPTRSTTFRKTPIAESQPMSPKRCLVCGGPARSSPCSRV